MIHVTFNRAKKEFTCTSTFEERAIPRLAGFSFDRDRRLWFTFDVAAAARLRQNCDESAKNEISRILLTHEPWSGRIPHPVEFQPLFFQKPAARFLLSRNRSYLGADPGLGKTIIASLVMNAKPGAFFLYVCPPFLVANVMNEFIKWVLNFEKRMRLDQILIIKDTMLGDREHKKLIDAAVAATKLEGRESYIIIDEAHRFKNDRSAKRAKNLFEKITPLFTNQIYMSGTPVPNRFMELYSVLSHAAPETIDFMTRFTYGRKFCGPTHNGFGWEFNGSSNGPELKRRVQVRWEEYERTGECAEIEKKFMLRIKKDVLNLPPKLEEIVIIDNDLPPKVGDLDRALLKRHGGEDEMAAALAMMQGEAELHTSTYRKELGKAKADAAIPFIRSILEDTDEAILVACWHKEVCSKLMEGLSDFDPLLIDGTVAPGLRVGIAEEFQKNEKRRVLIFNIIAGGIGLNLQRASRVVFAEFSWVPGENQQASDRAHRHGQRGSVLCQYLVYKNSIDRAVMETILSKQRATRDI